MGLAAFNQLDGIPSPVDCWRNLEAPNHDQQSCVGADGIFSKVDWHLREMQRLITDGLTISDNEKGVYSPTDSNITSNNKVESNHISLAKILYQNRRDRDTFFGGKSLFGEPAWDILLDLYASELMGKRISVTSACIASCTPTTTALRWLAELEGQGLVFRDLDTKDKRRIFVCLTDDGRSRMGAYFSNLAKRLAASRHNPQP